MAGAERGAGPPAPDSSALPDHPVPRDASSRTVLVVDDEKGVRDLMNRWLQAGGHAVTLAADATEALAVMKAQPAAVVLCDIRMPGHDGLWLADRIRHAYPETAIIMATGVHDAEAAAASLGAGLVGYLTKPFGRERLSDAVTRGIEWHRAALDARRWAEKLQTEVDDRRSHLVEAISGFPLDSPDQISAMFAALSAGDALAGAHGERVAVLAADIGRELGLAPDAVRVLGTAALLHDLGKLAMPEALLRKPAPLTPEESAIMHTYPLIGHGLLAAVPGLAAAAEIVRDAQERPDGLGYPTGLRSSNLSLGSRIVAVADAYDSIVRPRIYRDALDAGQALLEIDRCSGTQFDPDAVAALHRVVGAASPVR